MNSKLSNATCLSLVSLCLLDRSTSIPSTDGSICIGMLVIKIADLLYRDFKKLEETLIFPFVQCPKNLKTKSFPN